MSGTAAVGNTFASAVTATGAQLDANYSTIVAYLNDPTNRNNYATDGGTTNTVVPTFAPPVVGGYTAGLELTWKWAATNSGAVVLNANGLGNINVVNPDGSALRSGQGKVGSIGKAIYDGTRAIYIAATAQSLADAKAMAVWNGTATGTITPDESFNVSSIVRNGTGTWTIVFAQPFATTAYALLCTPVGSFVMRPAAGSKGVGTVTINSFAPSASAEDPTTAQFVAYGRMA